MAETQKQEPQQSKWWCNFCGYRSDDEQQYLKHSCKDELDRQGREKEEDKSRPRV